MYTIVESYSSTIKIKGSLFICHLFPIASENEFKVKLNDIKQSDFNATHYCQAFRFKNYTQVTEYSSDDGEPSGTAGLPMLNQLKSHDITQVGAVVVRYYGGTKLGKSGLIEAYSESVSLIIQNVAHLVHILTYKVINLRFNYELTNLINNLIERYHCKVLFSNYHEKVNLEIGAPKDIYLEIIEILESLDNRQIWIEQTEEYKMLSYE